MNASRMVTMMMVTATARAQTAGSDHRQYDDDDQRSTSSVVILNEQAWSRSSIQRRSPLDLHPTLARKALKTPCALVRRASVQPSYGVCTCVSVSMFTRVALIVPLIGGPAGVLPSGINCVISNVPE